MIHTFKYFFFAFFIFLTATSAYAGGTAGVNMGVVSPSKKLNWSISNGNTGCIKTTTYPDNADGISVSWYSNTTNSAGFITISQANVAGTWTFTCQDKNNTTISDTATLIVCGTGTSWNGSSCAAVATSDLTAGGVTPSTGTTGTPFTISSTISNNGPASTGAGFNVQFRYSTSPSGASPADLGTTATAALGAGANRAVTYTHTPLGVGTFYMQACADWNGAVAESNEGNNCSGWSQFVISCPSGTLWSGSSCVALPVATISQSVASTVSGGSYTITWGSNNATACNVTYTGPDGGGPINNGVSTSGSVSPATTIVGTYTVTNTCTNAVGSHTAQLTHTVTSPAPVGSCGTSSGSTPISSEPTSGTAACNVGTHSDTPADTSLVYNWTCTAAGGNSGTCSAPKYGCTTSTDTNYNPSGPNNTWGCANTCANGATNYSTCTTCPAGKSMVGGTCQFDCSAVSRTWLTNCSGSTSVKASGGTSVVTNTASGYNGSATYTCNNGTWSAPAGATCNVNASNCSSQTVNWSSCSGTAAATNNGLTANVTDSTTPNTGSATFSCNNGTFTVQAGSTCITPPTGVTLTANPTSVISGNASTLTWGSTNATSCSIDQGIGAVSPAASGNVSTGALTTAKTYTLTCSNAGGSTTAQATVSVTGTSPVCGTGSSATPLLSEPTSGTASCNPGTHSNSPADTTTSGLQAWNWTCTNGALTSGTCSAPKYGCRTTTDSNYTLPQYGANGPDNNYGCANTCANGATNYPTCTTPPSIASFTNNGPIVSGNTASLAWGAVTGGGTITCSINNGVGSATPLTGGSRSTATLSASTIYTITCSNAGGSATRQTTVSVTAATSPDLTASNATPSTAIAGAAVNLSAIITNSGTASTGASFSNFFQVATAANGGGTVADLASTAMATLASGGTNTASKSYTFSSAGTYSVRACADKTSNAGGGVITESNESNNCSSSWTNVTVTAGPTANITVTPSCTIPMNYSTCDVNLTWTSANLTTTLFTKFNGSTIDMQPTRSTPWAIGISNGVSTFTSVHNGSTLDAKNVTASCASGSLWNGSVCNYDPASAGKPDLTTGSVSPTSATAGNPQTFSATISNIGTENTGGSVNYLMQQATAANGGGTISDVGNSFVSIMLPGDTKPASRTHVFSSAGTYSLRICADKRNAADAGLIDEGSNEDNNCGAWTDINVNPGANLSVGDCSIASGASSCSPTVSWSSSGVPTTRTIYRNTSPTALIATGLAESGSLSAGQRPTLTGPGSYTFSFRGNGTTYDTDLSTVSCVSGTTWNGTTCSPTSACGPGSSATPQLTEPTGASACSVGTLNSSSPADTVTSGLQAWNWSCGTVNSCTAPKYGCRITTDSNYTLPQYGASGPNNNYGCASTCANGATNYSTCTICPAGQGMVNGTCTVTTTPSVTDQEVNYPNITFVCNDSTSYTVVRNEGGFSVGGPTTSGATITVPITQEGNYTITCINGALTDTAVVNYTIPAITSGGMSLTASPRTINKDNNTVTFTWSVLNPTNACSLRAEAVCDGGHASCTQAQLAQEATVNTQLQGNTDSNDPYGPSRNIQTAVKTVAPQGNPTMSKALGKKTITMTSSTDLILDCGTSPADGSSLFKKFRIVFSDQNEG